MPYSNNCPYKQLTAPPCWSCPHYIPDTGECALNRLAVTSAGSTIYAAKAPTYEEKLKQYEHDRETLLELSKEALVDLIIHRPSMF